MTDVSRAQAATLISARLLNLVSEIDPSIVSVFWPIEQNGEIDTRPFIRELVESGVIVALPQVSATESGIMLMRRFVDESDLDVSGWGALEPQSGRLISPAEMDLVVVPALAADRYGARVGYGLGYYDRFLEYVHCPTVSIIYSSCLLDHIPAQPHDIPTNYVVTELDTIVIVNPAT